MSTLDNIRSRFPWARLESEEDVPVEPLPVDGVLRIRLPWLSRFSLPGLRAQVEANPTLALWLPATGEYIVGDQWRNRSDIAHILEVSPRRGRVGLVRAFTERARALGFRVVVITDEVWEADRALYARLGFGLYERIVFFRKDLHGSWDVSERASLPTLEFRRSAERDVQQLLRLDHNSFPWLWWNSRREFEVYGAMEDVHIYIASHRGTQIGYTSFTMYDGWAHLDRIAVTQRRQGQGFGAAQLVHALDRMVEQGATHVALSTQQNNTASHSLYRGFGFAETEERMSFYCLELSPEE